MFDDEGYRLFSKTVSGYLDSIPERDERELMIYQRDQLKKLISAEKKWKVQLSKEHPEVFKGFISYIKEDVGNILAARPYFRERQVTFSATLSGAFKNETPKTLYKFKLNWNFIKWVLDNYEIGEDLVNQAKDINKMRQSLLMENIPLAISQARQFWRSTPKSHLSFMDIVQIQCQGLMLAIDKFSPKKETGMTENESLANYRTFRAVAIGLMTRDRVNEYSAKMLHFYPLDKQKIYWANKVLRRYVDRVDLEEVAHEINLNLPADKQTNPDEVGRLIAAASAISGDTPISDQDGDDGESVIESAVAADEDRPDSSYEDSNAYDSMFKAMHKLSLIEVKLLKLKGIKYEL